MFVVDTRSHSRWNKLNIGGIYICESCRINGELYTIILGIFWRIS